MKQSNTSLRLKEIMEERGLKQIDVLRMAVPYCNRYGVKLNKSDLSQYCSGKVEPSQDKLFILGSALNVSETWLMGFDVPRERKATTTTTALALEVEQLAFDRFLSTVGSVGYDISKKNSSDYIVTSDSHQWEITISRKELEDLEDKIMDYISYVAGGYFTKKHDAEFKAKRIEFLKAKESATMLNAAHTRTDIAPTSEDILHDEDIMDNDDF